MPRFPFALVGAFLVSTLRPPVAAGQAVPDSLDGNRIRAVEIRNHDVFPPSEAGGLIPKVLNGLHFTTRPSIIRRELLLRAGDLYDSARVAETERNLRALGVFRRVRVDTVRSDSGLVLRVSTQDAFTTRVDPRIKVSGRSTTWSIALAETNLFGTATRVGIRYRRTPDRTAVMTQFERQRLFAGKIGIEALYDDRSDGQLTWARVSQPFFSLSSRTSWYVSGEDRSERILRFYDGNQTARDTLSRRFWLGGAGVSFAPRANSAGYVRWGVSAQLRRDDYAVRSRADTLNRTVTGAVGAYLRWSSARYRVSTGVAGFGRDEDVNLSTVLHAGVYLTPTAFGYRENGFVPNVGVSTGLGWRQGFARFGVAALARITEAGRIDSGSVHLGAMVVVKPAPRQTAVFHASHGWQKDPAPGGEFDLGIDVGPRGFESHAFTGDRAFFLSGEYRYTIAEDFLRLVGLGVAAFADYGGAWYQGSARRTGYAFGVGFRFGVTFATGLELVRVDLARIGGTGLDRGAWRLAVGKGFVFNTSLRLDR